ncbi:CBS domain-containing protein [Candidatus Electrothrix aarhusensis]|uniref:CBS domain-containing protein n=1 Tax=Candidatus Electrothrix aarhusensis TaxID=1859131 RepID=A0A3S3SHR7_9BACT|nr:CBS domain-containing protein [Candidatus Electrothrix aarhusensis]
MLTSDKVPLIRQEETLKQAVAELNKKNIGAVLVVKESHKLCGIITDGDIRRHLLEEKWLGGEASGVGRSEESRKQITEIMTPHPVTISGELMAADALSLMQSKDITVLAVVDEDHKVEGILHLHDLLGKGEFRFLI